MKKKMIHPNDGNSTKDYVLLGNAETIIWQVRTYAT